MKNKYQKSRIIHLKVKVKSLAAEALIIRAETKKAPDFTKPSLIEHRKGIVRHHARHNLLAYGLLRGVSYKVMEKKCHAHPDFEWIARLAKKFGGDKEAIATWIEEAKCSTQTT